MSGEAKTIPTAFRQGGARTQDALRSGSGASRPGGQVPPSGRCWLIAALTAVVAPKCLLCLAGYLALGGAAEELCGGAADEPSVIWWLGGGAGAALLLVGLGRSRKKQRDLSVRPRAVR